MPLRLSRVLALIMLVVLVAAAGGCGEHESASEQEATEQERIVLPPIDEAAVLAVMRQLAADYNGGYYARAARAFSTRAVGECGGYSKVFEGMRTLWQIEEVPFRVLRVRSWNDGSGRADVLYAERIEGEWLQNELGLGPFIFSGGRWVLDDIFPTGARMGCVEGARAASPRR